MVRTFTITARQNNTSSALIFFDISAAYYTILHQALVKRGGNTDLELVQDDSYYAGEIRREVTHSYKILLFVTKQPYRYTYKRCSTMS